jgi:hypothetical protein
MLVEKRHFTIFTLVYAEEILLEFEDFLLALKLENLVLLQWKFNF